MWTSKEKDLTYSRKIGVFNKRFPSGKISLIAVPASPTSFEKSYNGFRLFIVNNTNHTISAGTFSSSLELELQTFTANNKWETIEKNATNYGPTCGNSFWNVKLPSRHYWQFSCPVYDGSYKTRLRFALSAINLKPTRDDPYFVFEQGSQDNAKDEEEGEPVVYYSNEFEGTINPAQTIPRFSLFPNVELPTEIFEKLRSQTN